MPLHTTSLELAAHGDSDIIDITQRVQEEVSRCPFSDGMVTVFVPGSSGGVIALELDPGLDAGIEGAFERWASRQRRAVPGGCRGSDNGEVRARSSLVGPSLDISFRERQLVLRAGQQIAFVQSGSRPRRRVLILQIMGS